MKLENIPKGYRAIEKKSSGGVVDIRSAQDNDSQSSFDNGRITITFEDDVDVKIKSKTGSTPTPNASKEAECLKNEQTGNESSIQGSHGNIGGKIEYRNQYSHTQTESILSEVLKSKYTGQKGQLDPKCDKARHSRDYKIIVKGDTLASTDKRKALKNVKVSLIFRGAGKCTGKSYNGNDTSPTDLTNSKGVAEFHNCGRNNVDIKFSDTRGYEYIVPVNNGSLGAKVRSQSSAKGQKVQIYVDLMKPYPDEWEKGFKKAAEHYWSSRQSQAGQFESDKQTIAKYNVFQKNVIRVSRASCSPRDVKIVLGEHATALADAGLAGSSGGANRKKGEQECSLKFVATKQARKHVSNRVLACLVFTHEYGHFLNYPDYHKDAKDVGHGDIMRDHMRPYIYDRGSKEYKRWINDTGCAAVTKNKPFAKFQGTIGAAGGVTGLSKAKQNTKTKVAKFKQYDKSTRKKFAAATDEGWTRFQKNYKGDSTQIKKDSGNLNCKPKDVKFVYRSFGSPNEDSKLNGYYNNMIRGGIGFAANRNAKRGDDSKNWYCKIYVNTDPEYRTFTQNPQYACVLFMHAYGRMLGYQNANNEKFLMNDTVNLGQIRTQAAGNECGNKYFK